MFAAAPRSASSGITVARVIAASVLAFIGLVFFALGMAAWAVRSVPVPAGSAGDVAQLVAFAPYAFVIAAVHAVGAAFAVSAVPARRAAVAFASAVAVAVSLAGAIAVAAGWSPFAPANPAHAAWDGVGILVAAAVVYAAVVVALTRPSEA